MIRDYTALQELFERPESTAAGVPFGNPPGMPTFDEAKVVIYGVPFDDTATFGKGAERGPEALRHVSARQIETFVCDEGVDIYEKVPVFDLGDLRIKETLTKKECEALHHGADEKLLKKLKKIVRQFDVLADITRFLMEQGKIPLMMGGEHTLAYWPLTAVADRNPVVLHFDAHRDAKSTYMDMDICHTTPMYHVLDKKKLDFVQIGIRQTDKEENDFAAKMGIVTFYPQDIRERIAEVKRWITAKTKERNVYITFDIDVLDICYTPCTGTPEPFGLMPEEVVELFKAIHPSARLIGADFVEVAVKNDDFREGTIATQLMLRLLAREFVR